MFASSPLLAVLPLERVVVGLPPGAVEGVGAAGCGGAATFGRETSLHYITIDAGIRQSGIICN